VEYFPGGFFCPPGLGLEYAFAENARGRIERKAGHCGRTPPHLNRLKFKNAQVMRDLVIGPAAMDAPGAGRAVSGPWALYEG